MSKDYGERWRMGGLSAINRYGCPIDVSEHARAVACVNALAGIPTESLGEVKMAWLASKLRQFVGIDNHSIDPRQIPNSHTFDIDQFNDFEECEDICDDNCVIESCRKLKERGIPFPPELNALLDSVKD